jgi:hypothetical protein
VVGYVRKAYGLKTRFERLRERGMLTVTEMARACGVSIKTISDWRQKGLIRACTLYAARVGRYGEALLDGSSQIRKANGRIARPELDSEIQNLGGKFVALTGTALAGRQARQTVPLKILFRLIEGGAREAECRG